MATDLKQFIPTQSGLEAQGATTHRLAVSDVEGFWGRLPANEFGEMEALMHVQIGGPQPYVVTPFNATLDNGATATVGTSGFLEMTTNAVAVDNDDMALNTKASVTVARNRRFEHRCIVSHPSVGVLGLIAGFVTTGGNEFFTASPTDGVYIIKAKNAAAMVGRVIANGAAAVDVVLGNFAAGFNYLGLSLAIKAGVGNVAAGDVTGGFWVGTTTVNAKLVPFSGAQKTALVDLINTTPAVLAGHLSTRVNGTAQRTMTVKSCKIHGDALG